MARSSTLPGGHHYMRWILITLIIIIGGSCAFLFFFPFSRSQSFTLSQVVSYVAAQPENPPIDNTDLAKPDYTSFFASQKIGFFQERIEDVLRLFNQHTEQAHFSQELLTSLLGKATRDHLRNKQTGHSVHKITPTPETKIVLWGDLEGGLHSFVRCLVQLRRLGMLTDGFKLTSPHYYLVFLGDVVGRGAYNMQLLTLVLYLMNQNLNQVVYLTGEAEIGTNWTKTVLSKQVEIFEDMNKFVVTLPRAVYVQVPSIGVVNLIRLSYFGMNDFKMVDETNYGNFLLDKAESELSTYAVNENELARQTLVPQVKTLICSDIQYKPYEFFDGLRKVGVEKDTNVWSLLSCPIKPFQKVLNFKTDSFAMLAPDSTAKNWLITHFAQDSSKKNGFKNKVYYVFTGEEEHAAYERKQEERVQQEEEKEKIIEKGKGIVRGTLQPEDITLIEREEYELARQQEEQKELETAIKQETKASREEMEALVRQFNRR